MNEKNLCETCIRGKVCRELPKYPCEECAGYVAEQKWISIKDKLPEMNQRVIVCRPSRGGIMIEQGQRDMNGWWRVYGTRVKSVTHWMPLPDAPKE